jgi:ferritin-like metal-binding protein YciE
MCRRGRAPTQLGQALAGLFTGDEVMKALVASTAFEEIKIASYKNIIAAAQHFGDHDTKRVCEGILGEEVEMRDWFESQIPGYTREYLEDKPPSIELAAPSERRLGPG